jgi:acyl-CoA thioester hydrolase
MHDHFSVRVEVRSYEVDANGHLNHAYYHRYGEHARTEHLRSIGATMDRLVAYGAGVVLLETHVRFLRELRHGDTVDIDSRITFGEGKSFAMDHTLRRVGVDGAPDEVAAEIRGRLGLMDHATRRLLADPGGLLGRIAAEAGT